MDGKDNSEFDDEFEKLVAANNLERAVVGTGKEAAAKAQAVLETAAVAAAMSVVNLAQFAQNEQLRFRAATYVLDKVIGDGKTAAKTWSDGFFDDIVIPDNATPGL